MSKRDHGSCECICAGCGSAFTRRYRMNATRKQSPQYCSKECKVRVWSSKAKGRLAERFWSKVAITDEAQCWEWQGMLTKAGYGYFNAGRKVTVLAHRHSYMLTHGTALGQEIKVCHSCDNPRCVNPSHLWLGDDKANFDDMVSKGRHSPIPVSRGVDVNTSRLTEAQAREVLASPLNNQQLAQKFGVSKTAIRLIRIGRNWAHLQEAS